MNFAQRHAVLLVRLGWVALLALVYVLCGCRAPSPKVPPTSPRLPELPPAVKRAAREAVEAPSMAVVKPPQTQTFHATWDWPSIDGHPDAAHYQARLFWAPTLFENGQWREIGRYPSHVRDTIVSVPWSSSGQFGIDMVYVP